MFCSVIKIAVQTLNIKTPIPWVGGAVGFMGGHPDCFLKIIKKGYSITEIIGEMRREKEI